MSDLISRDALLEHIDRRIQSIDIAPDPLYRIAWEIIRDWIEYDAPTVDAEPVVRCKDCKHRGTCDCPMLQEIEFYDEDDGWDYRDIDNTDDDGFCHNGAKIDGGVSYEAD